jgi:hypothetical protein
MNMPNFASRHHAIRASRCAEVSLGNELVTFAGAALELTQIAPAIMADTNKDLTDFGFIFYFLATEQPKHNPQLTPDLPAAK